MGFSTSDWDYITLTKAEHDALAAHSVSPVSWRQQHYGQRQGADGSGSESVATGGTSARRMNVDRGIHVDDSVNNKGDGKSRTNAQRQADYRARKRAK